MEDEALLSLLGELSERVGTKLMDIYVEYYDQLRVMYKLICLSKNSIAQLRKRYSELSAQLESLQKRHSIFSSHRLGKLVAEL